MLLWFVFEVLSKSFTTIEMVSGWYPVAGLGVALLWGFGLRYAWVVLPATLLGGVGVWGQPAGAVFVIGLVNTLTYSGAAWLLRRAVPPGRLPGKPVEVGVVVMAALACALLNAAGGVGTLLAFRLIPADIAGEALIGWAIGDALGIFALAPLMIFIVAPQFCLLLCKRHDPGKARHARIAGSAELFTSWTPWLLILGTAGLLVAAACLQETCDPRAYYLGFALLPILAMRYRLAGGLFALLAVIASGLIAAELHGMDLPMLVDLQLIMIALSISTILVASFAVMRAAAEQRQQTEHQWATLAIRGSGMGRWYWEVGSDRLDTDYILTDAFGYRRDKVEPTVAWWQQRTHPEDNRLNQREIEKLLSGRSDYFEVENRMLAADGTWGWFHSQGTVIERDAQGRPKRVAGTHHDITERKELENIRSDAEATHRSEQRFRTLADGAPVAIFQTDAKGVFLYVNPAWKKMTGLEQTDALYRSAAAFTHRDDRNDVADNWAAAVQTGTAVGYEHRVATPDGRTLWLQTQATPMKHNGVLLGFVGTGVDVTPYREAMAMIRDSEARYRTLADHAYDMLWRVSADADFTYVSPSITKLMGYAPEEMVGTNAFDYFHPEDLERVREKHGGLSPDAPEFHDVHRYRRKDGSYIVFEAVGRLVVPDQTGTPPYITGISRDVTQRVESERIQRELEEKLARSQKLDAIGTFATGIAHDFRNTLMAIKLSAQSAARTLDDGHAARPALDTVNDACAQAMAVTQSLLTFAKGQGAAQKPTDLAALLWDNTRLVRAVVPPGIELQLDCPDQKVMVRANAGAIQQVLLNLVMNAKDAIDGEGRITVRLEPRDDAAVLTVADDGCGMEPGVLSRATEPFFTTRARLKGTGLGLAQVHGIVTDHAGDLALRSTPGQGTTITITLPLLNPANTPIPADRPEQEATP